MTQQEINARDLAAIEAALAELTKIDPEESDVVTGKKHRLIIIRLEGWAELLRHLDTEK